MCCVFFSVERGCFLISKAYWKMKLNTIIAAQSVMFNANFIWFKKTKTTKKTKQHRKYTSQIIKTTFFFFLFFNIYFFQDHQKAKTFIIHKIVLTTSYLFWVSGSRMESDLEMNTQRLQIYILPSSQLLQPWWKILVVQVVRMWVVLKKQKYRTCRQVIMPHR